MRLVWLSLMWAPLWLCGCDTPQVVTYPVKPSARLVDFRIQDAKLDYVSLYYDVEIDNPNAQALPVAGLNMSLTHGGNILLTGSPVEDVTVPPYSCEVVTLTDRVIYARLLRTLHCEADATIPYQLKLWLRVGAAGADMRELSTDHRGELTLPPLPEIEVDGKVYHAVDVIYVATPQDMTERMLALAGVTESDLVYDLGCGDGRIVVTAAKQYGCRAVGYDIDPQRVQEARENVTRNGVAHLVRIEQKDIFTLDLSAADVITLYLTPTLNVKLLPQLRQLRPGVRIVSHSWGMAGVPPGKTVKLRSSEDGAEHVIYLWTTPL